MSGRIIFGGSGGRRGFSSHGLQKEHKLVLLVGFLPICVVPSFNSIRFDLTNRRSEIQQLLMHITSGRVSVNSLAQDVVHRCSIPSLVFSVFTWLLELYAIALAVKIYTK